MRKVLHLLLAVIIAVAAAIPFSAITASAAENEGPSDLPFLILKEDANSVSSAGNYFVKPATLTVEDGKNKVQMNFTGGNMIEDITLKGIDSDITRDGNNGTLTFEVDDLSKTIFMDLVINAGSFGKMYHTVRLFLNVENIADIPEAQLEASLPLLKGVEEGYYTVSFDALHATKDQASSMARYMNNIAFIDYHNGNIELTMAVKNENVTKLKVNGQEAIESQVINDLRYDTFSLDKLTTTSNGYVEYQASLGNGNIHYGTADFRIAFDKSTLTAASEDDKYPSEGPTPNPGGEDDNGEDNGGGTDNEGGTDDNPVADPTVPDKAYTIDYVVKHAVENKPSAANSFFVKPGVLLTKGDKNYLQLTISNSNYVDSVSTANGPVTIVEEREDGSIVVQFLVDQDLTQPIKLDMHITVPGMYSSAHTARLVLDLDSKVEVDAANYKIVVGHSDDYDNGEGTDNGSENGEGTDKGTGNDTDKNTDKPGTDNNENVDKGAVNPQTGETSNLLLYILLLIGSLASLTMIIKRRFA